MYRRRAASATERLQLSKQRAAQRLMMERTARRSVLTDYESQHSPVLSQAVRVTALLRLRQLLLVENQRQRSIVPEPSPQLEGAQIPRRRLPSTRDVARRPALVRRVSRHSTRSPASP